jgi:hypothetical protein
MQPQVKKVPLPATPMQVPLEFSTLDTAQGLSAHALVPAVTQRLEGLLHVEPVAHTGVPACMQWLPRRCTRHVYYTHLKCMHRRIKDL